MGQGEVGLDGVAVGVSHAVEQKQAAVDLVGCLFELILKYAVNQ